MAALCASALPPRFAMAQVDIQIRTNYYVVTGATLNDIHLSLRQSRPWGASSAEDGRTDWKINWRTTVGSSANGCQITSAKIHAAIILSLPVLRVTTNTTAEVVRTFQNYLAALMKHEQGHVQICRSAAGEMQGRIQAIGAFGNCSALQSRINEVAQQALSDCRQRQNQYDRTTRHGASQGAVLPGFERGRRRPHPPSNRRRRPEASPPP